jgi:predicted nucleic acid-binding Zn ribbon protein
MTYQEEYKMCRICGTSFKRITGNQLYCSKDCQEIAMIEKQMSRAGRIKDKDKVLKTHNINKRTKEIKRMWAEIVLKCEEAGLSYGEAVARGVIDG